MQPISEDQPTGEYLLYEGTYDRIRAARQEDDSSLPQGVWERELKRADWLLVRELCLDALRTRSKDLQIAVWLLEALMQLRDFAGLREGLQLISALCEKFWENLHPAIEDNDFEARIAPLVWMNEKLAVKLKFKPITRPSSVDALAYSFADWERANAVEKKIGSDKQLREQEEKAGKVTRTKFLGSVMFTPRPFYSHLYKELSWSLEPLVPLAQFLEDKCARNGPSLTNFRNTLEAIRNLVGSFLKEKKEQAGEPVTGQDLSPIDETEDQPSAPYEYGKGSEMKYVTLSIRSRGEAYRMLAEASDYLSIHEPHSPTPYLVKRAVTWGNMTLAELLQELVNDQNDLRAIFKLLGLHGRMPDGK